MSQIGLEKNKKNKNPEDCVMNNTEQVNDQLQSVGENTQTILPVNKTNISKINKTTHTDHVGNSNQSDVKVRNFNKTNPNKSNFCEMKKNEHFNEVAPLHETNKIQRFKKKRQNMQKIQMILMIIKYQVIIMMINMSMNYHRMVMIHIK